MNRQQVPCPATDSQEYWKCRLPANHDGNHEATNWPEAPHEWSDPDD